MKFIRRRFLKESEELNITAFMNLMVILVPFLLITAVFSRLTVLELNLPALGSKAPEDEKVTLQLQVVVREDGFQIEDANLGPLKGIPHANGQPNWKVFTASLVEIKSRFPEADSITLLLARGVSYKILIEVMDRVRTADIVQNAALETVELFPNISIGDAPAVEGAAGRTAATGAAS
jgi:biopolymer transport protein ExbD